MRNRGEIEADSDRTISEVLVLKLILEAALDVRDLLTLAKTEDKSDNPIGRNEKWASLRSLIGKLESNNNYNIVVGGKIDPEVSHRTIAKNQDLYGNKALGRYQIQAVTARDVLRLKNLNPDTFLFDIDGQNNLFVWLLERRGLNRYLDGEMTIETFARNLSKEWASLPSSNENFSYYRGVGENKALTTWAKVLEAIEGLTKET